VLAASLCRQRLFVCAAAPLTKRIEQQQARLTASKCTGAGTTSTTSSSPRALRPLVLHYCEYCPLVPDTTSLLVVEVLASTSTSTGAASSESSL
jgi:hypothetical protein